MRKRVRILILSALVAAVAVPVGFALSLDTTRRAVSSRELHFVPSNGIVTAQSPMLAVAVVSRLPRVPDGAKLLMAGAALFGLAAAMRRGC